MLSYHKLQDRPRDFLAATGLTLEEFQKLLPAFQAAYAKLYPSERTREGKLRQRRGGGGAKGVLQRFEDKLLFILVYQKTNPLQTMHALQFDLSQPQANYWIHQLLPVLQHALAALGHAPERDASRLATSPLALEGAPAAALDGTERRRQRPTDAQLQKEHYSGKKKTHTDKNLLLVNETDRAKWSISARRSLAERTTRKPPMRPRSPIQPTPRSTKILAFRAMSRTRVLTAQPKKSPKARR